ncbi:MAG: nucleotidyltransferase domain-containing protein [Nanoarchaeota archaeon]
MMVQKCSLIEVMSVFFKEPTEVHFIKEIGRKIGLAPTSVRVYIEELKKQGIIIEKEARPFNGLIANRESNDFIFYKRLFNIYSLKLVVEKIAKESNPRMILLFGSYSKGFDIETSDVDLLVLSKSRKGVDLSKFVQELNRKINVIYIDNVKGIDKNVLVNMKNGIVLQGAWDE